MKLQDWRTAQRESLNAEVGEGPSLRAGKGTKGQRREMKNMTQAGEGHRQCQVTGKTGGETIMEVFSSGKSCSTIKGKEGKPQSGW